MALKPLDSKIVLQVNITCPNSRGDCQAQVILGDAAEEIKNPVRGWMLEAVMVAQARLSEFRERLERNIVADFLQTERAVRRHMELAEEAASAAVESVEEDDDKGGGTPPEEPPPALLN